MYIYWSLSQVPGLERAPKSLVISQVIRALPASFCSIIWFLTLSLTQNSSNPCKTLSNKHTRSNLFSNEVTLGGSYTASECGLLTRKTKPRMKAWNFQTYPHSPERGQGLEKKLFIKSMQGSLHKSPSRGFGEAPSGQARACQEGNPPQLHRDRKA